MQNRIFNRAISAVLIVSLLGWTVGCYTTKEITRVEDAVGDELHVLTKGNNRYHFFEWKYDSIGNIRGRCEPDPGAEFMTVPRDSVVSVQGKELDVRQTIGLILCIPLVAVAIALVVWVAKGGPHTQPAPRGVLGTPTF